MKKSNKHQYLYYIWIARDERKFVADDDMELNGKLHIFYDAPILKNGIFEKARLIGEIPSYMFPSIKEKQCRKFVSLTNDIENKLPQIVDMINESYKIKQANEETSDTNKSKTLLSLVTAGRG